MSTCFKKIDEVEWEEHFMKVDVVLYNVFSPAIR